jgi:hypothetical protein
MSSTLVIILSETRASELTFDNFKKNVIDELNADLCVCIGIKPDYDYENPFYKLAKYRFTYPEPDDYGEAFDYAYSLLSKDLSDEQYIKVENMNPFYGKIKGPKLSGNNIEYLGTTDDFKLENANYNIIGVHSKEFENPDWKDQVYGTNNLSCINCVSQNNLIMYKKTAQEGNLHWREFLKIPNQFMGGVKDPHNQHSGSAGILIFFRWFLLKNLIDNDLINKYDRFIITRSDYIYQLPHPQITSMNKNNIWIPDSEQYSGYTDRHVVLSNNTIESYLNILNNFVKRSREYFTKMQTKQNMQVVWNLEQLIAFHLEQNNVRHLVKEFPYIMYTIRNKNGTTRWCGGTFSDKLGYYIKYPTEYEKSSFYKNEFDKSGLTIDAFYKKYINSNYHHIKTPISLNTLDASIINEFEEDLKFVNIDAFINSVNSASNNQIPDICKKYMTYTNGNFESKWSSEMIDEMLSYCNKFEYDKLSPNDYPKCALQIVKVFNTFVNITDKSCLVLGSISPWIECLLLHFNAKSVTTLDYIAPKCDYKINVVSMDTYNKSNKYDIIVSFSSLEHDGLGRYGDPINPNGDIDACINAYNMLNKDGYFICGIPIGNGCIEGNFHRIYNKKRIDKLFSIFSHFIGSVNYETLDNTLNYTGKDWQNQPIFVYKK